MKWSSRLVTGRSVLTNELRLLPSHFAIVCFIRASIEHGASSSTLTHSRVAS
jgi:hypothetical protein